MHIRHLSPMASDSIRRAYATDSDGPVSIAASLHHFYFILRN